MKLAAQMGVHKRDFQVRAGVGVVSPVRASVVRAGVVRVGKSMRACEDPTDVHARTLAASSHARTHL